MCWEPAYALLLLASTVVDFSVGLMLGRVADPKLRRRLILPSLAANLGFLFYFKYYDFVRAHDQSVLGLNRSVPHSVPAAGRHLVLHVPDPELHTRCLSERAGTRAALWPLRHVCGLLPAPGGRSDHAGRRLIPQLRDFPPFEYQRVTDGLKLVGWGLFKKVVIADRLARLVDPIYADFERAPGIALMLATVAFAYQIYCDFSGYTDIAIGISQVLGVTLVQNFRAPYHSRSLREFWTRWHISLSTWFRDYVYIPLGGNRVSPLRWAFNIMVVFGLSGLWHGANWTYVVWGLYHGMLLIAGRLTERFWRRAYELTDRARLGGLARALDVAATFTTVSMGWILFRSRSLADAWTIMNKIVLEFMTHLDSPLYEAQRLLTFCYAYLSPVDTFVVLGAIAVLEIGDVVQDRIAFRPWLARRPAAIRWAGYCALVTVVLVWGQFNGPPFIYFQF